MENPRAIVETGYDAMADEYLTYIANIIGDPRAKFLAMLDQRLAPGSDVLDLGCGAGTPSSAQLATRHHVLGIDISAAQILRARQNVPSARFEKGDFTTAEIAPASLDAVTAFYSLTHVPQDEHGDLFRRIAGWLRPDGYFLGTLSAHGRSNGVQADFIGVPMFFSGHDAATNRTLLRDAGWEMVVDEVVSMVEPDGASAFHWVLARLAG
ncbi:MAG: class I SAM-dependent methyltransferase [Nakamurella sp.]